MRKIAAITFIVASCSVIIAGCNTITAPNDGPQPVHDFASYFWQASDSSYVYSAPNGVHQVRVGASGLILDRNLATSLTDTMHYESSSGGIIVSGLERSLLFSMTSDQRVVRDSVGHNTAALAIRQLFTVGDTLYGVDDRNIWSFHADANKFENPHPIPFANATYFVDFQSQHLYAYIPGTKTISHFDKYAQHWSLIDGVPGNITVAVAGILADDILIGTASGLSSYDSRFRRWRQSTPLASAVVSIALQISGGHSQPRILAATADGTIAEFDGMDHVDTSNYHVNAHITGMWSRGSTLIVGSDQGLYLFDQQDADPHKISSRPITGVFDEGYVYYASSEDGFVMEGDRSGSLLVESKVSNSAVHSVAVTPKGVFALSGVSVYFAGPGSITWSPLPQTIQTSKMFDPGSFRLFTNGIDSLAAGYVLSAVTAPPQVFQYTARLLEEGAQITLDSVIYKDIIVMRYAVESNSFVQFTQVPSYQIIFARGIGPIRIEKTYELPGRQSPQYDTTRFLHKAR